MYNQMLQQLISMYDSERRISYYITELRGIEDDAITSSALFREADENRSQRERIEGLLFVLKTRSFTAQAELPFHSSVQAATVLFKKLLYKHAALSYANCMEKAFSRGRLEIIEELENRREKLSVSRSTDIRGESAASESITMNQFSK
jgi:hypothetical protein